MGFVYQEGHKPAEPAKVAEVGKLGPSQHSVQGNQALSEISCCFTKQRRAGAFTAWAAKQVSNFVLIALLFQCQPLEAYSAATAASSTAVRCFSSTCDCTK